MMKDGAESIGSVLFIVQHYGVIERLPDVYKRQVYHRRRYYVCNYAGPNSGKPVYASAG